MGQEVPVFNRPALLVAAAVALGEGRAARFPAAPGLAVRLPRLLGAAKLPEAFRRSGKEKGPLGRSPAATTPGAGLPSELPGGAPAPGSEPGPLLGLSQLEV